MKYKSILLLFIMFAGSTFAQDSLNTNDGPHVFWENDSTAIVFYYCNDKVESETYIVKDTFRFNGMCDDSETEYTIIKSLNIETPDIVNDVEKFFAISDIHGEYDHFVNILINASIVDSNLHWNWEDGHLVITGDVFDRGPSVTECLWLIYQLEREAYLAGGAVHLLMGNHELMVLRGDLRYVHERYMKGISKRKRFKHDELFGPDMELGKWLRTKQTVMKINSTLFMHGGITLDMINQMDNVYEINEKARAGWDYSSPRLYFDNSVKELYSGTGAFWYRGYLMELENRYPAMTTAEIDSVLTAFDADQIVVGHSNQDSLVSYHDGKVLAIDVRVDKLGGQEALLWENDQFYRIKSDGERVAISGYKE